MLIFNFDSLTLLIGKVNFNNFQPELNLSIIMNDSC